MNELEMKQKLEEALKDEEFKNMLFEQDTPEKIQEAFASKGIELSLDEVKALVVAVVDAAERGDGVLDEAALEDVSGGFAITSAMIGWGVAALLAGIGTAIGWKAAKGKCR